MVLAVLLATGAGAVAQTTPPRTTPATKTNTVTTPPATDAKLDGYLKRWETEMRKVQTLSALISRVDKDKVFSTTRKFNGWAQYAKSGSGATAQNLAALELKPDGKTEVAEKIICTGTYLYQFVPAQKEIRVYDLPKPKPGQVSDDSFLGFLFGMKADDAKKRYTLKLANEDKWYIYVDIVPRDKNDKADFVRARLCRLGRGEQDDGRSFAHELIGRSEDLSHRTVGVTQDP